MAKRWYYKDENGNKVPVPQYKIDADDYYTKAMSDSRYYDKSATDTLLGGKVSKTDITQSTGTSETAVMSQKAVSDALSTKVDKSDIVQSTGTSTTAVMSQKASTDSFIANTPSGDPMHNLYVKVGAKWNAKTGFWELNGLTDITNEQMLTIYVETNNFLMNQSNMEACYCYSKCRTNIPNIPYLSSINRLNGDWIDVFRQSPNLEVIVLKKLISGTIQYFFKPKKFIEVFRSCLKLRLIDAILDFSTCVITSNPIFFHCYNLESVKLYHLNKNIALDTKMLSSESVQYMIENATDATITITLHPEAYERAIADAGVQTALANKPNVSLAKGE